jgi:Tfp pilus assembly protein PilZ
VLRVQLNLGDKSEWVKVFDPRDQTVFVAGSLAAKVGDIVRIDLCVSEGGPRVILRGRVIARRDTRDGSAPPGSTVALGPEEREKINYLNGFVRGGLLNLRERRRLPLRVPVTYGGIKGPVPTFTRDVNEEGVFVVTEQPLPEGSEVHLIFRFPNRGEGVSATGTVSHTVVIEDEDVPGMGIVFAMDADEAKRFAAIVDELERAFLEGSLPDDLLL